MFLILDGSTGRIQTLIIQGTYNTTMDLDKMVHYDNELDFVEKMYAANFRPETGTQIQINGRGEIGFSWQ